MKKILIITFFVFTFFPNILFAQGACLIKEKTPDVLNEYIKNNRQIVKNITNTIKNNTNNSIKGDFKGKINIIFNEIFSFDGYSSYFNYFVIFPVNNDIPYSVKRDYNLLNNENKRLIGFLDKITARGNNSSVIDNICNNLSVRCDIKNIKVIEIIGELIQNNEKILNLYRKTIIGEDINYNISDFILVDNNFLLEIEKNYGKDSIGNCNNNKEGFFKTIEKAITNIKLINKQGEKGIQKRKDARNLLVGNNINEEKILEKKLLKGYLTKQGISQNNRDITLKNLEKYNLEGISENNNIVKNTIDSITKNINEELKPWKEEKIFDFVNTTNNPEKTKILKLNNIQDNKVITQQIQEKITNLYENEIPFSFISDISTEKLKNRIIDTHISLDNSIKILEETIQISRKVCNSQDRGNGICE